MSFQVVLRIFGTRKEAESAQKILKDGGFDSRITEDKFEELTLQELNIPPRFRLYVDDKDYFKIAEYLNTKMPKRLK